MASEISSKIAKFAHDYRSRLLQEQGKTAAKMTKYDVALFMKKEGALSESEFNSWIKEVEGQEALQLTTEQQQALKRGTIFSFANQQSYLDSDEVSDFTVGNVLGFEKTTNKKTGKTEIKSKAISKQKFNVADEMKKQSFMEYIKSLPTPQATYTELIRSIEFNKLDNKGKMEMLLKISGEKFNEAKKKGDKQAMKEHLLEGLGMAFQLACKKIDDATGISATKDFLYNRTIYHRLVELVDKLVDDGDEANLSNYEKNWEGIKGFGQAVADFVGTQGVAFVSALELLSAGAAGLSAISGTEAFSIGFNVLTKGFFMYQGGSMMYEGAEGFNNATTKEEASQYGGEFGMGTIMFLGSAKSLFNDIQAYRASMNIPEGQGGLPELSEGHKAILNENLPAITDNAQVSTDLAFLQQSGVEIVKFSPETGFDLVVNGNHHNFSLQNSSVTFEAGLTEIASQIRTVQNGMTKFTSNDIVPEAFKTDGRVIGGGIITEPIGKAYNAAMDGIDNLAIKINKAKYPEQHALAEKLDNLKWKVDVKNDGSYVISDFKESSSGLICSEIKGKVDGSPKTAFDAVKAAVDDAHARIDYANAALERQGVTVDNISTSQGIVDFTYQGKQYQLISDRYNPHTSSDGLKIELVKYIEGKQSELGNISLKTPVEGKPNVSEITRTENPFAKDGINKTIADAEAKIATTEVSDAGGIKEFTSGKDAQGNVVKTTIKEGVVENNTYIDNGNTVSQTTVDGKLIGTYEVKNGSEVGVYRDASGNVITEQAFGDAVANAAREAYAKAPAPSMVVTRANGTQVDVLKGIPQETLSSPTSQHLRLPDATTVKPEFGVKIVQQESAPVEARRIVFADTVEETLRINNEHGIPLKYEANPPEGEAPYFYKDAPYGGRQKVNTQSVEVTYTHEATADWGLTEEYVKEYADPNGMCPDRAVVAAGNDPVTGLKGNIAEKQYEVVNSDGSRTPLVVSDLAPGQTVQIGKKGGVELKMAVFDKPTTSLEGETLPAGKLMMIDSEGHPYNGNPVKRLKSGEVKMNWDETDPKQAQIKTDIETATRLEKEAKAAGKAGNKDLKNQLNAQAKEVTAKAEAELTEWVKENQGPTEPTGNKPYVKPEMNEVSVKAEGDLMVATPAQKTVTNVTGQVEIGEGRLTVTRPNGTKVDLFEGIPQEVLNAPAKDFMHFPDATTIPENFGVTLTQHASAPIEAQYIPTGRTVAETLQLANESGVPLKFDPEAKAFYQDAPYGGRQYVNTESITPIYTHEAEPNWGLADNYAKEYGHDVQTADGVKTYAVDRAVVTANPSPADNGLSANCAGKQYDIVHPDGTRTPYSPDQVKPGQTFQISKREGVQLKMAVFDKPTTSPEGETLPAGKLLMIDADGHPYDGNPIKRIKSGEVSFEFDMNDPKQAKIKADIVTAVRLEKEAKAAGKAGNKYLKNQLNAQAKELTNKAQAELTDWVKENQNPKGPDGKKPYTLPDISDMSIEEQAEALAIGAISEPETAAIMDKIRNASSIKELTDIAFNDLQKSDIPEDIRNTIFTAITLNAGRPNAPERIIDVIKLNLTDDFKVDIEAAKDPVSRKVHETLKTPEVNDLIEQFENAGTDAAATKKAYDQIDNIKDKEVADAFRRAYDDCIENQDGDMFFMESSLMNELYGIYKKP